MREFEQKRKTKKILSSPFLLVPLILIFLFLARGTWNVYLKDRASGDALRLTEDRLARAKAAEAQISGAIGRLQTATGIESEIRDKLQMGKEGEQEVVILDNTRSTTSAVSESPGILQKIWNFFTIR